ncbi:polysaccharide deacetylase family protein [Mycoplasmatota bacterium zrk1]
MQISSSTNNSSFIKNAYLTIDDGPTRYTEDILNILKQYNVRATFFLLEPNIQNHKEIVTRMIEDGHSIGLHGVTHEIDKIYGSEDDFIREMNQCNNTLEKLTGKRTRLVRAPHGSYPYLNKNNRNNINNNGYILWDWNIDCTDSSSKNISPEEIIDNTKSKLLMFKYKEYSNNPVLLLHDKNTTKKILPNIIRILTEMNYKLEALNSKMQPVTLWDRIEEVDAAKSNKPDSSNTQSKIIYKVDSKYKKIAFTYDCGFIDSRTSEILDYLKKHNVKATFFLTGVWAEKFPELTNRIVNEGHEIGTHTYNHPHFPDLSYNEIIENIKDGESAIRKTTGISKPLLFRLPYGEWNNDVLVAVKDAGYDFNILWSIDTIDWKMPPSQFIVDRILKNPKNGDIVLMHIGGYNTAFATNIAIGKLKANGFHIVKVSELLNDE